MRRGYNKEMSRTSLLILSFSLIIMLALPLAHASALLDGTRRALAVATC